MLGGPFNPYAHVYRAVKRALRWGPPAELEDAAPPRFANLVGFLFTGTASVLFYVFEAAAAAWALALIVSALALLAATTGLCVGCEMYALGRRLVAGRSPTARAGA